MSIILRLGVGMSGVLLLYVVLRALIRRKLQERQSLIWLFTAVGLIIVGIFPQIIFFIAKIFGVEYAPSMIFAVVLIISIFGLFKCYQTNCDLERRVNEMARQVALLNAESVENDHVLKAVKKSLKEDSFGSY